jgi:hypothetical protein
MNPSVLLGFVIVFRIGPHVKVVQASCEKGAVG